MSSLLVITHINFWYRDLGSRNRLYDMLIYLKNHLNITVVFLGKKSQKDIKLLKNLNLEYLVTFIDDIPSDESTDLKELESFVKKHQVLKTFVNKDYYSKINTLIQNNHFQNIIVEYIHLSYFLPLLKSAETYLDAHDIMYKRNELFKQNDEKHWIDITKTQELTLMKEYDYTLSIQKAEHNLLKQNNINSILAPYSFSISTKPYTNSTKSVVFIAGDNLANKDSISWFIDNIWNDFTHSGYSLEIYGSIGKSLKQNIDKNIYIKGKINNLDELYTSKTTIVINPVTLGGGLKIKNVEAIASGIPLLTTNQGALGMEDGINDAFLVATTHEEWKNYLTALMISKTLRVKLSNNAKLYAANNFQSDVCYKELTNLLVKADEY